MPQPESTLAENYDLAVLGASPFALLLAGTLASQHKLRVALIGERFSTLRLPPGLGLSVGPMTRPDSWALLRRLESETLSLLSSAGAAAAIVRQPVTFRADLPYSATALEHVRHMALGHGIKAEPLAGGGGIVIRDAGVLSETALHLSMDIWLKSIGVERIDATEISLALPKRGNATLIAGSRSISASQIVLADDAALLSHLEAEQIPSPLTIVEATVVLTSPVRSPPSGPTYFLDRQAIISSRGKARLAHLVGPTATDARLASMLEADLPLVRLATRRLRRLESQDGAPLIGWLKEPKLFIAAGMGPIAPFLAPLAARAIANAVLPEEKAWLAARDPARTGDRLQVADFAMGDAA